MKAKNCCFFAERKNSSNETSADVSEKNDQCVLHKDVLIEIFKKLDMSDLKNVNLVSKKWNLYANSNIVWKAVCVNTKPRLYTEAYINEILNKRKNIRNEFIIVGIKNKINKKREKISKLSSSNNSSNTGFVSDVVAISAPQIAIVDIGLLGSVVFTIYDNVLRAIKCKIKEHEIKNLEKEYNRYSMK